MTMKRLDSWLMQRKWYRELFTDRTFILVRDRWIDLVDFRRKDRIDDVDGKWNTQFFCSRCNNELVHSQSFVKENGSVAEYECTHCGKQQYGNLDVIPGIVHCDEVGIPL